MKIRWDCIGVGAGIAAIVLAIGFLVVWTFWASIYFGERLTLHFFGKDVNEGWLVILLFLTQAAIYIGIGATIDCCIDSKKNEPEQSE